MKWVFFFCTAFNACAIQQVFCQQVEDQEKSFEVSAGGIFAHSYYQNRASSSLPFSGGGWGASLSATYKGKVSRQEFRLLYSEAKLSHPLATRVTIGQRYITADYLLMYPLATLDELHLSFDVGGAVDFLYSVHKFQGLENNGDAADFAASLSPTASLTYRSENVLPGLAISGAFSIPCLSAVSEPSYTAIKPSENAIRTAGFKSFFRVIANLKVSADLNHWDRLSVSCLFDYYNRNKPTIARQSTNAIEAAYTLTL